MRAVALAVLLAGAGTAAAAPCDEAAARAHLEREAGRARRWDTTWAVSYALLAVGHGGLLAAGRVPLREWNEVTQASLRVGVAKSSLGALNHVILALRIPRGREGGACAAVRQAATAEKRTFYLKHAGGLLVNLAGLVYLGVAHDAWLEGALTFTIGYPILLLDAYTQPRAAWRGVWRVHLARAPAFTGVHLAFEF